MKKLLFILLGFTSLSIYANGCGGQFDPITGTCRIIGVDGKVVIYNSAPPQSAPPPPQKIIKYVDVYVPSKYGALAHDKYTGNVGGSLNGNSLEEAKKVAIKQCAEGGKNKNCKIVQWVRNGCVAGIGGKKGNQWILFTSADVPGKAESVAMDQCKKSGAKSCKIIMPEGCSVPEGMYQ